MKDFGIENYFYLILLVIAAVSGLLGKSRKTPPPQNKPKDAVPQDWEDVFGELFGKEKPQPKPVVFQTSKSESQKTVKSKIETQKPVYQPIIADRMTAASEGMRTIKDVETEMIDIEEDSGGFSLNDIPDNAEEWRKMIVYNEIFNRKY
jgi:hypothetical protein